MKRTKVQIERQTEKAYIIIDSQGRKGWIQKRWMAADGSVSEKTLIKSAENFKQRQASRDEAKEWANSYHRIIEVKRETEKAVAIEVNFDAYNLERNFRRLIWIPKSMMKDMAVQGWLLAKKIHQQAEELVERIHTGVLCDYVPVEDCDNRML